ncbi:glycosyltransferase [candidate division GN15 bacterium]|nr:glycosyltransferase [candidate division GN15 bacterium]
MSRILVVAGYLGRFGETDGVVTTYRNLLPRLAERGIEADVLVYGPDDAVETVGSVTVVTHRPRVPIKIDPSRWIDLAIYQSKTSYELGKRQYDLVHSSSPDPLGLFALSMAKRSNSPLVTVFHTALDHYVAIRYGRLLGQPAGKMFGNLMYRWLAWYYNQSDLVLAPTQQVREELETYLNPEVRILSRGVNTDDFSPHYRQRSDSRPRACYVGRVAPEKNLQVLVDLFTSREDVDLSVTGDGPFLQEMQSKLPRAIYNGRLKGEDLSRAYADGDFFVFPSRTDTLGNVVLEAMSSGLPVVVSDAMGPKEMVEHGKTGFVAHTDDEFAKAVDLLSSDAELRARMGAAARESAQARSWDSIADQLIEYYEKVLHGTYGQTRAWQYA